LRYCPSNGNAALVVDSAASCPGSRIARVARKFKRGIDAVRKTIQEQYIYSKPTMCLHCHLIVEMVHERDADPQKGAWNCPQCGHVYPFQHWKIRKQSQPRKAEAA
jgi:hypothetical protein